MIRPKKPTPVSIFTFLSRTILPLKAIKMLPWIFPTCSQDNRFSASNLKRFAWERTRTFYKLLLVWRSTFASIKFDLSSSDEWLLQQSASLSRARLLIHTQTHMHARTHPHAQSHSLFSSLGCAKVWRKTWFKSSSQGPWRKKVSGIHPVNRVAAHKPTEEADWKVPLKSLFKACFCWPNTTSGNRLPYHYFS